MELFFTFFFHSGKCSLKGITRNMSIFGYCGVQAISCNAFILRLTPHLFGTNRVNHLPRPIFLKPIYSNETHIEGYVNGKIIIYIYICLIHNLWVYYFTFTNFQPKLDMLWHMGKDH